MSRTNSLRFRKSGATVLAAMIAFVGTVPFAGARLAFLPVLLVPLAVGVWAWRAGTDVDATGLRVRALAGTNRITWDRVAELGADPRGRASALLTDGNMIRLTGVRAADLPAVVAAGGGRLERPSVPVDHPVEQRLIGDEPA